MSRDQQDSSDRGSRWLSTVSKPTKKFARRIGGIFPNITISPPTSVIVTHARFPAGRLIASSGYRIGPGEIEEALVRHPAVALAAAIGVPDEIRTEAVKAFVVLAPGFAPSDALAEEIQAFVRDRLARHEIPRSIEFLTEMPLTTTGKVMRRVLKQRELDRLAASQNESSQRPAM